MVFSGLVTACRLAGCPTSRSPSSVKATIEGVVRMPSAFSITRGDLPSITATQELVVPRSMPMTLPMVYPLFHGRPVDDRAPLRDPRPCRSTPGSRRNKVKQIGAEPVRHDAAVARLRHAHGW